ncbi:MAG: hypothetical protein IPL77_00005, partial [Flavobacteriales bacterium]|nr:hypothetical protein [Flavobacteriales bacterium]
LTGYWKDLKGAWPIVPLLLLWAVVPAALGYAYSVWRAPVLQHSVLLFSFPFLLLALLGGLKFTRPIIVRFPLPLPWPLWPPSPCSPSGCTTAPS